MLWEIELLIHFALVVWIWRKPDGRPGFSAWLAARFLFDAAQFLTDRFGYGTESTTIWYFGVVAGMPLLWLAMHESPGVGRWHRMILYGWTASNLTAAWIRFFPYTGRAVLVIDATAFVCWMAEKAMQTQTPHKPSGPVGR